MDDIQGTASDFEKVSPNDSGWRDDGFTSRNEDFVRVVDDVVVLERTISIDFLELHVVLASDVLNTVLWISKRARELVILVVCGRRTLQIRIYVPCQNSTKWHVRRHNICIDKTDSHQEIQFFHCSHYPKISEDYFSSPECAFIS